MHLPSRIVQTANSISDAELECSSGGSTTLNSQMAKYGLSSVPPRSEFIGYPTDSVILNNGSLLSKVMKQYNGMIKYVSDTIDSANRSLRKGETRVQLRDVNFKVSLDTLRSSVDELFSYGPIYHGEASTELVKELKAIRGGLYYQLAHYQLPTRETMDCLVPISGHCPAYDELGESLAGLSTGPERTTVRYEKSKAFSEIPFLSANLKLLEMGLRTPDTITSYLDNLVGNLPRFVVFINRLNAVLGVYDFGCNNLFIRTRKTFNSVQAKEDMADGMSAAIASISETLTLFWAIHAIHRRLHGKYNATTGTEEKPKVDLKKIKMGTDLEYSIVDSDFIFHSATEFVADSLESQIGTDGNVETLELRPDPANTPEELVHNCEILLSNMRRLLPDGLDILGGGGEEVRRSTGAHIHFSGTCCDMRYDFLSQGSQSKDTVRRNIENVCSWFDILLRAPMCNLPGNKRWGTDYGRESDWRAPSNHEGFPHDGFEYRSLPNFFVDKDLALAIFRIAYMIIVTYESGGSPIIDETKLEVDNYRGLKFFDRYQADVELFIAWCKEGRSIGKVALRSIFNKSFVKDKECDVTVTFANDKEDYLNIKSFLMYNPQKMFSKVVVYSSSGPAFRLSEEVDTLNRYILKSLGSVCVISPPSAEFLAKYGDGKTLCVGVPSTVLSRLARESRGSRNRIKMFVQELIKNM